MKKIQFLLLILLLIVIHSSRLLGQCNDCEQLYVNDPRFWWNRNQAAINEVRMVVKPAGKFYQLDVYMTYQGSPLLDFSEYDTLEVVHFFRLPKHVSIIDSWLWVGDTIMEANILERNTAFNIYEGIVNRRKDPSVLYKNGEDNYEYRIFPLPGTKSRKVKLSFLIASDENEAFNLPLSMFALSYPRPEVKIFVYKKDTDLLPSLDNGISFEVGTDPAEGDYAVASISANKYSAIGGSILPFSFKLQQNTEPISLITAKESETAGSGFYQICLDPANLLGIDTLEKKKVVFVVDHHASHTYYSKGGILSALKNHIRKIINPKDQFRIIYNNLTIKEVSAHWMTLEDVDLDSIVSGISLGNNGLLTSLLYTAYEYVQDEEEGVLMVMSSDASVFEPSNAQSLKDELKENVGVLRPTFILDYASYSKHNRGVYYGDKYYYGNELFYKILSSNTKGKFFSLALYNGSFNLDLALGELQAGLEEARFDYVNYYLRPQAGLCYDDYEVSSGTRIIKTGRFVGQSPFQLEVVALYNDQLITKVFMLDAESQSLESNKLRQCYAMSKILDLEGGNISESEKNDIIEVSIDNRVLSRYTAFLALEPGLEPCFNCADDDDILINVEEETQEDIHLMASPNPFAQSIQIAIKGLDDLSSIDHTLLTDLSGKNLEVNFDWKAANGELITEMDGSQLVAGVYVLRIVANGRLFTYKLIKI